MAFKLKIVDSCKYVFLYQSFYVDLLFPFCFFVFFLTFSENGTSALRKPVVKITHIFLIYYTWLEFPDKKECFLSNVKLES